MAHWAELRKHFGKLHVEVDKRRDDLDAKVAQHRADRATTNAVEAVEFALYTIDEAEASVLDAADAQEIADALK